MDYEDIEQINVQPVVYEEIIALESCPAYASTTFTKPVVLNDSNTNQYEEVNH